MTISRQVALQLGVSLSNVTVTLLNDGVCRASTGAASRRRGMEASDRPVCGVEFKRLTAETPGRMTRGRDAQAA